jgi:hypothetical protein
VCSLSSVLLLVTEGGIDAVLQRLASLESFNVVGEELDHFFPVALPEA